MSAWLTALQACVLTEREPGDAESEAYKGAVEAACEYVQRKRLDLFTADEFPTFTAGADVKLGTAMLANRFEARQGAPLGTAEFGEFTGSILRYDPDIAKLLGIGTEGGFHFGAARPAAETY